MSANNAKPDQDHPTAPTVTVQYTLPADALHASDSKQYVPTFQHPAAQYNHQPLPQVQPPAQPQAQFLQPPTVAYSSPEGHMRTGSGSTLPLYVNQQQLPQYGVVDHHLPISVNDNLHHHTDKKLPRFVCCSSKCAIATAIITALLVCCALAICVVAIGIPVGFAIGYGGCWPNSLAYGDEVTLAPAGADLAALSKIRIQGMGKLRFVKSDSDSTVRIVMSRRSRDENVYTNIYTSANVASGVLTVDTAMTNPVSILSCHSIERTVYLPNDDSLLKQISLELDTSTNSISFGQEVNDPELTFKTVSIATDTGSIKAKKVNALEDMSVKSGSGSITLDTINVGGSLSVEDGSGSISVTNVKAKSKTTVSSGSGSVDVINVETESLQVTTKSGSQDVDYFKSKNVLLESGSGSVEVNFNAADFTGTVEAKSDVSNVKVEGTGVTLGDVNSRQHKKGKIGNPDASNTNSIKASTGTGSLKIHVK